MAVHQMVQRQFQGKNALSCVWFKYPELSSRVLKHLLPFVMSCCCEFGFSDFVEIRSKKRNPLDVAWCKI
jgi:hypothetical protein